MERACVKEQGLKPINTLSPESQVSVQAEREALVQNMVADMFRKSWAVIKPSVSLGPGAVSNRALNGSFIGAPVTTFLSTVTSWALKHR